MDFLMDYLPAIQFAAALNIGYIIPNILKRMYKVLENIDTSYKGILDDVKNKIIVKNNEICSIQIIETKDDLTTKTTINKLTDKLNQIQLECDSNASNINYTVDQFISCSGYRSMFFYSALFSVLALLLIPFCYQHDTSWSLRCFFYIFSSISLVYLMILFLWIIAKKKDVSCRGVLGFFILFIITSMLASIVNNCLPTLFYVDGKTESILSWLSIVVAFLPGICCLLFLMGIIIYSIIVAKRYAYYAHVQFKKIDKVADKLNEMNRILNGEISIS